jgi:hypothetical protein
MSFTNKYTTAELVSKEAAVLLPLRSEDIKILSDNLKLVNNTFEKDKVIVSNDAYAIGNMLDVLNENLNFRLGRL